MRAKVLFALIALSLGAIAHPADAQKIKLHRKAEIYAAFLKKAGLTTVQCPRFVTSLKTGLTTSLADPFTVCVRSGTVKSAYRKIRKAEPKASKAILSGQRDSRRAFQPVQEQEGDVQTDPFVVADAPAMIHYSISTASFRTLVRFQVVSADTGRVVQNIYSVRGTGEGSFAWNYPGRYYLKLIGTPDSKSGIQPKFSVSMEFVAPEAVGAMSRTDFSGNGIRLSQCPAQVVNVAGDRSFSLRNDMVCSDKNPLKAGTLAAPVNTAHNVFTVTELEEAGEGGYISVPFRISKPTPFTYSISDPSDQKGTTKMYLVNYSTRASIPFVSVRGSIDATTTFINQPGDYFLLIDTTPFEPQELGDLSWSISVAGGL